MDTTTNESTGPDTTGPLDLTMTGPTGPTEVVDATGPTGPAAPVITIDDLLDIHAALVLKESQDRASFLSVFQPSDDMLKNMLVGWASMGFPPQRVLASVQINPPPKCSDGEVRNFFYYCLYLAGIPDMTPLISVLEERAHGMDFDFILTDTNTFSLIVSKTA